MAMGLQKRAACRVSYPKERRGWGASSSAWVIVGDEKHLLLGPNSRYSVHFSILKMLPVMPVGLLFAAVYIHGA